MENVIGILKKENKEREKRLIISDRRLISDMVAYIKTKKLCDFDTEMIRKSIIRTALRTYGSRKKDFQTMVGEDFKPYCDKLCQNARKMTTKEWILSRALTFIVAVSLMYAARLIDVFITGGNFFTAPVDINLGFLAVTATLIVGIGITYLYVSKLVGETGKAMSHIQSFGMLFILGVIILISAASAIYLSHVHLFNIEWWIPVLVFGVLYGVLKFFYVQYENELAKEA